MKSQSLKVQQIEKSRTAILTGLANQMQREGIDVIALTAGEPDFPTPTHVKQAAIKAIEENFTHYTALEGIPELIDAIAEKFKSDNNLYFDRSQILVSCGAKQSIFNTLQALCNPGDEVIFQAPHWVTYPSMVKLVGATPRIIEANEETRFKVTAKQLRKAINTKTKVFLFNSPANPTGTVYSQGEIEELAEVVRQTGIYVISDEVYEKIIFNDVKHFSIGSIKQIKDQVITVNGVSKAYAMTGWRIGYLGATEEIVRAAAKVQGQVTSNPNSIAQRAAVTALNGSQDDVGIMVNEFRKRRDFVVEQLSKISGLEVVPPQGAFYVFPSVKVFVGNRVNGKLMRDEEDICRFLLENEHLVIVPGAPFGGKKHFRMSFACSMKELEEGMKRLRSGFKKIAEGY
ncbi:MAG: pyridoxal phosphate-dependent aminotransferase [Bacteroidota bacterium]|nr:pyridoxal phosphate-dependent aminotransferase [Bacteroidota bacterium]